MMFLFNVRNEDSSLSLSNFQSSDQLAKHFSEMIKSWLENFVLAMTSAIEG